VLQWLRSIITVAVLVALSASGASANTDDPCSVFVGDGMRDGTMAALVGNYSTAAHTFQRVAVGYAQCSVAFHRKGQHRRSIYAQLQAADALWAAASAFYGANDDANARVGYRMALRSAKVVIADGTEGDYVSDARSYVEEWTAKARRWGLT